MADICGSDLHQWHGDIDLKASGVRVPAILGHEMTGKVAKLGEGVSERLELAKTFAHSV